MHYVSFFSGALGLDLGLEAEGWNCLARNEYAPPAIDTIRLNRPQDRLYAGDIRDLDAGSIRRDLQMEADVVVGGPPCQAFSTAGRRQSLSDERGNVFLHFLYLATSLNPKLILIENVRGLLSASLDSTKSQPGAALASIIETLQSAGYTTTFDLYDVANFGVAQRRERLILLAARRSEPVPHLQPTHTKANWRTFGDVTHGLVSHDCLPLRSNQVKFLPLVPPGGNWRNLPAEVQHEALGGAFYSSGGRVGFYRRLHPDSPSPTLVTAPTMPATLLAHPTELRALSIQEYLRIQGFPDGYRVAGSLLDQYRQIGNAVPVEFGRAIARHINAWMQGSLPAADQVARTSRYRRTSEAEWGVDRAS